MTEEEILEAANRTLDLLAELIRQDAELTTTVEEPGEEGEEPKTTEVPFDRFPSLRKSEHAQIIGQLGPAIFAVLLDQTPEP